MNKLETYAELLIHVGVNLQLGEELILAAPVDLAPFARLCAKAAYDAGCSEVHLLWDDDFMTRARYLYAADASFDTFPAWRKSMMEAYSDARVPRLMLSGGDPKLLDGVSSARIRRWQSCQAAALKRVRERSMNNEHVWCIAALPTPAWAKTVFPDMPEQAAMERLWEAVLSAMRITDGGDTVAAWRAHVAALAARRTAMTAYGFTRLHYHNALGTDFTVGLPENAVWLGGSEIAATDVEFVANMPTEEVFTCPHREKMDGTIVASMPLVLNGCVVDGVRVEVKDGRIVHARAKTGEQLLLDQIALDEGASHFGELALVPCDSPISRSGLLFYRTLFDENASCHVAFGAAYPSCVAGGEHMSADELLAAGVNDSAAHVDFMIGTEDLSITGYTKDGREIPVFRNGRYAF